MSAHEMHTNLNTDNRKVAMWTLIGSECFLFGSLIANYVINKSVVPQGPKPHEVFNIDLTTFSTFVLLMSSVAMVLALDGCVHKSLKKFRFWTAIVVLGGAIFLGCQAYEFTHFVHEGLGFTTSPFGSSFFLLTGCHGAHVTVGVLWMSSILLTSFKRGADWFEPKTIEVAGLYWHFVDVVWILIFTIVYLFVYL
jgi:cytochrome c oxidase subunit III